MSKWINPIYIEGSKRNLTLAYSQWLHMRERCRPLYWERFPTYIGATFQDEWKDYDIFYDWITDQVGYGLPFSNLDKDLLGDGKLYSAETCCILPQRINIALTYKMSTMGEYPSGVSLNQGRYMATLAYDGKNKNLGRYSTPKEASDVYIKFKTERIQSLAYEYKDIISDRAFNALMNIKFK